MRRKMSAKCMSRKCANISLWIGSGVFVVSLAILLIFPTIYKMQMKKEITLTDGSLVTKFWEDIPLPIYEKLYFFNITNEDDFLKGKPLNVTEVGPYTYKGSYVKIYPQWNPNGTVSYRELRTYQFVPDMSVGSEDDEVYTLNGPLIIAADMLKKFNIGIRAGAAFLFRLFGETVITKRKIRELVYEGYKDKIIEWAPAIKPDIPYKDGRFSWLYGKNNSDDGLFTVFTGVDDASKTDIINNWNGQDMLTFWKGDTCNMINGTSIETGPPLPDIPESYTFFQTIFCRSLTFNYTGEQTHRGVLSKHFQPTDMIFANGTENPANSCFDLKEGRASGVLDIRPCQFDAAVLMSFPHFYLADPSYLQDINGLSPNGEDHGSHLDVEPITGISVDARIRFQINLEITHTRGIFQLDDVSEGIYPVFWTSLEISLDDYWAHFLKSTMNNPKIIAYSVLCVLAFMSLVLIICSLVVLRSFRKDDEDDPLLDIKEEHKQNLSKKTLPSEYGSCESQKENRLRSSLSSGVRNKHGGYTNEGMDVASADVYSRTESVDKSVRFQTDDDVPILSVNSPSSPDE